MKALPFKIILSTFVVVMILSQQHFAHANELYNQSKIAAMQIRPISSENNTSNPIYIEVCTTINGGEKCKTYPDLDTLEVPEGYFSWKYFLNRCNGFIVNNNFVFGAKVLHSAMILGIGLVTGGAVLPTTGKSLIKFLGTASGLSGTSAISLLNIANWSFSPEAPYPDFKISAFPSDKVGTNEDLYFSGMARAQQMIDFILRNEDQAKVLGDLDILSFQEILSSCNDISVHLARSRSIDFLLI